MWLGPMLAAAAAPNAPTDAAGLSLLGVMLAAGSALGGALCGAVVGQFLAARNARNQALLLRAQALVDEFHSASFAAHRGIMYGLPEKLPLQGPASEKIWDRVAMGFANPALYRRDELEDAWLGEMRAGFTEHEHLGIYVAFVVRLAQLLRDARGNRHVSATLVALRVEGIHYDSATLKAFAAALDRAARRKGAESDGLWTVYIREAVAWADEVP